MPTRAGRGAGRKGERAWVWRPAELLQTTQERLAVRRMWSVEVVMPRELFQHGPRGLEPFWKGDKVARLHEHRRPRRRDDLQLS